MSGYWLLPLQMTFFHNSSTVSASDGSLNLLASSATVIIVHVTTSVLVPLAGSPTCDSMICVLNLSYMTRGPIHKRSQTAVAHAISANVVANDFATSQAIHETNRTCDHRKFGRKLSQNLRRTFRCRKYVLTITLNDFIAFKKFIANSK